MVVNSEWAQVEVIELQNDGGGLAFGIIGGRSTGVVVKTILPGGVADRDGRLQSGDHILRIGEVSMRGLGCEQAAAVLRQCGVRVRLLVARPADPQPDYRSLGASNAPIVPTKVLGDPDELDRHLVESGYAESVAPPPPEPALVDRYEDRYVYRRGPGVDLELLPITSIVDVVKNPAPVGPAPVPPAPAPAPAVPMLPLDMAVRPDLAGIPQLPEMETFQVQLKKDVYGLGITVAGYVCEQEELSGIFVKSISTGSSADLCNKIQINDRIVEVDFKPLQAVTNHQAVELLRGTGPIVHLKLERYLRGPRYERLQKALKAQGVAPGPPSPSVTSLPRCPATMYEESSVIDPEAESRVTVDSPHPTSPVTPPPEDVEIVIGAKENREDRSAALRAIQDKWREILSLEPDSPAEDDVEIVVGKMIKEPGGGLGISLEGTVEVENGKEVRPHHYIRSLLQDGPVGRSGQLKAGDELLEVNGRRLLGLHHLEVVKALKQLPASVCLVCARRPSRRALIDTAQHRAAFAARNILGGSLQNLLPLPERMIKAKSESSIASMCSTNTTVTPSNIPNPSLKSRSRSLEPMSGLAMWSDQPEYIELMKGDRGLGFSILDYQDPVEPKGTVIVVRSVVAGGAAARAGTLRPGDRLLSVNGQSLAGASLAHAVQALKTAPKGIVRIGVAKPLPSSSLGSADRGKRNDSVSSQEGVNSGGSDDHTGFDSYHECLQEYQECLEVVQICLEPEDSSLREDDMSNLEDFSFEEMKNDHNSLNGVKNKNNKVSVNGTLDTDKNRFERITKDSCGNEFYNVRDLISDNMKYTNGNQCESIKLSEIRKSDDSLDGNDEDMTITEDDPEMALRTASSAKNLSEMKINQSDRSINKRSSLSKGNSRDLSTSDEMVFAVTPTGLERVSFERYWREGDIEESSKEEKMINADSAKSDESWKDCSSRMVTPCETIEGNLERSLKSSLQDTHLLYIDHDVDGYDTCLEDDSSSAKAEENTVMNNVEEIVVIKEVEKVVEEVKEIEIVEIKSPVAESLIEIDEINQSADDPKSETTTLVSPNDNRIFSESIVDKTTDQINKNLVENESTTTKMNNIHQLNNNVIEVIETQEQCLNNNVQSEPKSTPKVHRIRVVEYYNDEAECLEEYKRQMKLEEERNKREKQEKSLKAARAARTKNFLMNNKSQPSEESTDQETYAVPGCHKCFLESYAYEITKAYYAEASKCKFCAVVKEILEPPKRLPERSSSAPAIFEVFTKKVVKSCHGLMVHDTSKDRRQSAGPLKFLIPSMDSDSSDLKMTVSRDKYTASPSVGAGNASASAMEKHWGQARQVAVHREPNTSLGISIVGGKVDISNTSGEAGDVIISGIFIKNVVPNSPAGHCGQLRTGDRILEVDGVDVRTASHEKAVQIIRAAGNPVNFLIQSLLPWNTDSSDVDSQKLVTSSTDTISGSPTAKSPSPRKSPTPSVKVRAPTPPKAPEVEITAPESDSPSDEPNDQETSPPDVVGSAAEKKSDVGGKPSTPEPAEPAFVEKKEKIVYSDDEDSEDEDEDRRELEGRTYSEKGKEIDRASAGNVKRTKEEKEADPEEEDDFGYTTNKVKKKYSNLGHTVVAVRLERGPRGGLGISLAGHRDRSRMAVFVCGLRPGGAAYRAGSVLVGDEILEVNGVVLHGRCHLNASAIIKGLAGPVFKVILLRRTQALDDVAVKPLTQFPVTLEDETDENRYAAYKNVRTVTIKKGTQSLGIMIIEGRHAEVGQGIFISDIQEGSAAEQAGLAIGDMILAVNKDTLLGSNYDTAASMLKKTEGVVVLLVCNPNKKDESGALGAPLSDEALPPGTPARPGSATPARTATTTPAKTDGTLKGPTHISRPNTPAGKLSLASPAKAEPIADPATAPIVAGKESLIDITTENKPLGVIVVGGQDTLLPGGAVLLEVYPDGKAAKDGRLKPGDQILDCNGVKITPEMKQEKILSLVKQTVPKMKMTVLRPETVSFNEIEVDLIKKPGKGLGLGVMAKKPPPGVYISELVHGGIAEVDGRLQRGDIILSVCGQSLKEASCEDAAAALKCAQAKVSIKVARHKLVR